MLSPTRGITRFHFPTSPFSLLTHCEACDDSSLFINVKHYTTAARATVARSHHKGFIIIAPKPFLIKFPSRYSTPNWLHSMPYFMQLVIASATHCNVLNNANKKRKKLFSHAGTCWATWSISTRHESAFGAGATAVMWPRWYLARTKKSSSAERPCRPSLIGFITVSTWNIVFCDSILIWRILSCHSTPSIHPFSPDFRLGIHGTNNGIASGELQRICGSWCDTKGEEHRERHFLPYTRAGRCNRAVPPQRPDGQIADGGGHNI